MALSAYTIERFGGLDLINDPLDVGATAAVDLSNVDFDQRGRLRCRDGYSDLKALTMDSEEGLAVYDGLLSKQVIAGYTTGGTSTYAAYNALTGASVASTTVTSIATIASASIMVGTSQYLYLANGNGGDSIRRWDGSSFTSPSGMPNASYLAITPVSNRLVAVGVSSSNFYRVQFSDPGTPETWGSNNYIDLPYGGGFLTGAQTWQDMLFVFKSSGRFFIFTGESVDSTGNPVFNYRGIDGYSAWDSAAGAEGVYFHDGRTVWLTTGGIPRRVSEKVDPYLQGDAAINGETVDQTLVAQHRLSYSLGRLYLSHFTSAGSRRTLVYDPKTDTWTRYSVPVNFARTLPTAILGNPQTLWLSPSGVEAFDGSTDDAGSDISWSYVSGWYPLSDPGRVAITRESSATGYSSNGSLTLDVATEDDFSGGTSISVSTIAGGVDEGFMEKDKEGKLFRHQLSGSFPTVVNRVTHYVSFVKPTGIE